MNSRMFVTKIFSIATVFFLLGFFLAIPAAWYTITPLVAWASYAATAVLSFVLYLCVKNTRRKATNPIVFEKYAPVWGRPSWFMTAYFVLWAAGFAFLLHSRSGSALFSPWQTISPWFLVLFFALSVILGIVLFSTVRTKFFLIMLLMHSVLLHLYLPLSHENPWGGDVWRMIAVEEKVSQGDVLLPVLFGPEALIREVHGISLPEALIIPHKYVYSHLWGTTLLLQKTLSVDLVTLNIWLIPILWSVLMPLILYRIGIDLFQSRRNARIVSALSFLFFPLQALGGLTLAVSLGTVVFFFILMLYLHHLHDPEPWKRRILCMFAVFSVFGYTLYFLMLLFLFAGGFLLQKITRLKNDLLRKAGMTSLVVIGIFLFPAIEIVSRSSYFSDWHTIIAHMRQMIGQFSGWFYASAIRPHDIYSGNILFNHTPEVAYVSNLFTSFRWHLVGMMVLLFSACASGIFFLCKTEKRIQWRVIGFLVSVVLGGYMIGWYVLSGDRSFVRRLDPALSILLILLAVYGIRSLIEKYHLRMSRTVTAAVILFSIVFFGWVGTTTLASGPDMRVVSVSEREAAQFVWEHLPDVTNSCVIADTWPLLALEGLSGQAIVGGGFPQDYLFAQPERTVLYAELLRDPRQSIIITAQNIVRASSCAIMVLEQSVNQGKIDAITAFMDIQPEKIGDMVVWVPGIE